MTTTTTNIESITSGFEYSIEYGRDPFYDENNDRMLDQPEEIVGGWAPTREAAERRIQEELAE